MWTPPPFETKTIRLDFSSSEQGRPTVTQIYAGELQFANAVELAEWNTERVQLLVCEDCGFVHCARGNWVAFRSAGDWIVVLPAFAEMYENDDDWSEYEPPAFLAERGSMVLGLTRYEELRRIAPELPTPDALPRLSSAELAQLAQWEAPARVLGDLNREPTVVRDMIVAASVGEPTELADAIQQRIEDLRAAEAPVTLRPVSDADEVVELYLDADGYPAWKVLVDHGERPALYLEPGWVARSGES